MCECSCSEVRGDLNIKLKGSDDVVSIDFYRGCRDCAPLIGVDVRVFNAKGVADFLGDADILDVGGDEYGHIPTFDSIELISLEDLQAISRTLPGTDDYENLADWLSDHGLDLLQGAFDLAMERRDARNGEEVAG